MPKQTPKTKKSVLTIYLAISILLLCFAFYGNSLRNQYSLDDQYVIVNKLSIQKGIFSIPEIFTSHYSDSEIEKHSYRPITTSSFALEYQFFGVNPFISHLINLLLYAFCCFLVFRLVLHLDESDDSFLIGSIAAFIFLILPVHSEVVNNVKCRDELLCFSFGVLSLIQFLKYGKTSTKKNLAFGVFYYLLSLFSKTTSLTLIALIPFAVGYFKNIKIKRTALFASCLIASVITLKLSTKLLITSDLKLRELHYFENPLFDGSYSFWERIPLGFASIGDYLKLIFFPGKLSCYYGFNQVPMVNWSSMKVWLSITIVIGLLSIIYYAWKRNKLIAFGLVWFLVSISMFTNIVKPVVGIIAERFAFLPSTGISIAVAALLYAFINSEFYKRKPGIKISIFLLCGLFFCLSWNKVVKRNANWYNEKTLYQSDVKNAPNSAKLHNLLASHLFVEIQNNPPKLKRAQLTNEAISHFKSSVQIHPEYANAWNNLGTLLLNEKNDAKQSLACFEHAITHQKEYKTALFGAGYSCELLENKPKALFYYKQVAAIDHSFQDVQSRISKLSRK